VGWGRPRKGCGNARIVPRTGPRIDAVFAALPRVRATLRAPPSAATGPLPKAIPLRPKLAEKCEGLSPHDL